MSDELKKAGIDDVIDIVSTSEFDIVMTIDGKHDSLGTREGGT